MLAVVTIAVGASWALAAPAAAQQPPPPPNGCMKPPSVSSAIPGDTNLTQQDVNCFAWQEFIALNWLADTTTCAAAASAAPSSFGDPSNTGPVVWQTYKSPSEVFLPDAEQPLGWCQPQRAVGNAPSPAYELSAINKFATGGTKLDLSEFHEAKPANSWLTAQSGLLTLYDIRMNQDEFQYITTNKLYDAEIQQSVTQGPGISFPDTSNGITKTGSIELKAAWTELDDESDWPNYLTTKALVTYPGPNPQPKQATMGLVGLHIIHKTFNAQQFVWATFEHVDNAPSASDVMAGTATGPYTFYNPNCDTATDPYQCRPNPRQDPDKDSYSAPVQVVREQALVPSGQTGVVALNEWVWNMIAQHNEDSVFRNYELVNVLWPQSGRPGPAAGSRTPLPTGNAQPPLPTAVANTTLETFVQDKTCQSCHAFAPIASPSSSSIAVAPIMTNTTTTPAQAPYAADYSFLLSRAQSPPGGGPGALVIAGAGAIAAAAAAAAVVARRRRARSA